VALEAGMTVAGTLDVIREAAIDIPVVAFGYLNPILAYGLERFLADAANAGVSGLLLTDLPVGEDPIVERTIAESGLELIRLVAPTTDPARLALTVRAAQGFIYVISRLGVTGASTTIGDALSVSVAQVRRLTELPVAVGFGIGTGAQAAAAAQVADGVVVGSAFVRRLGDGVEPARRLIQELADAIRAVGER
jgi:tryptophan synthase alpha chain